MPKAWGWAKSDGHGCLVPGARVAMVISRMCGSRGYDDAGRGVRPDATKLSAEVTSPSRPPKTATLRCVVRLSTDLAVRIPTSDATVRRGIKDTCPGGGPADVHGHDPGRHRHPRPGRQERLRSGLVPPRRAPTRRDDRHEDGSRPGRRLTALKHDQRTVHRSGIRPDAGCRVPGP
jgi:hypothetical protein